LKIKSVKSTDYPGSMCYVLVNC